MGLSTIVIIILVVLVLLCVYYFNALTARANQASEAWSDIQIQMKRRYNIIPNLIETVKGYAKHEASTLDNVVKARNAAIDGGTLHDQAMKENVISQALKSVFALSESYPELKANENFLHLQNELVDVEDKLQASRRFYNANVRDLNIMIEQFPSNIMANLFKFGKREFFELDEAEADAASKTPEVKF